WDARIMEWLIEDFRKETGIDLHKQPDALQRIKEESEKAKIALSSAQEYEISLPFVTADASGPKHIQKKLSRAKMEELCDDLFERTVRPVHACLRDAKLEARKIDELVLVGGMTRMPKVVETAHELIDKAPHQGVNPDEVVAVGAGIQGGVLKGEVTDVLLLDVTPLTLGVETKGGIMAKMIPRNTTIPTRKSELFTTAADDQTSVEVRVFQGENDMCRFNRLLGNFHLDGIPPAPAMVPQIEVTFDIDANGILHVTAKDTATNKEQKIRITGSSGLSKDEVERMRRESEQHAEEDKKLREQAEARNDAERSVHQGKKLLKEHKDKISDEHRRKIEDGIGKVEAALKGDDMDAVKRAVESLNESWHEVSSALYAQAQAQAKAKAGSPAGAHGAGEAAGGGEPEGGKPSGGKDGGVIDADFEVVDEGKKKGK
ncbi:MAG: molecular chaperone DnaK, partial [Verrucomicrobia bacterium]|nr:molecular chaperone DnaK [Verrucomicrobiota bacterium]